MAKIVKVKRQEQPIESVTLEITAEEARYFVGLMDKLVKEGRLLPRQSPGGIYPAFKEAGF